MNQTKTVEKKEPLDNEFMPDADDSGQDDAARLGRVNEIMRGTARQVSLDPADDMGL
ncbi:hypothetical protein GALL_397090 [mine drainage metagenome]|uniref:Uncharacterized protein n=1 Tax=mine drainage metagenome TaxID=410659 RepID=A0A1J5Q5D2_9ZZZZ